MPVRQAVVSFLRSLTAGATRLRLLFLHHLADERVSTELKTNLMKARLEKKLTQAQLAQQINELPKVVQDYEAGKAIPNQAIISKMERALGVKLRPAKK